MGDIDATSTDSRWIYYRIYTDDFGSLEPLLTELVAPVVREARPRVREFGWFFLRYLDPIGFQLRVRLRGTPAALPMMEEMFDARLRAASALGGRDRLGCRQFGKYVYAPEYAKYGSAGEIRRAERIFEASSELALSRQLAEDPASPVVWAAACLLAVIADWPDDTRLGFLYHYTWYWTGGVEPGEWRLPWTEDDTIARRASSLAQRARDLLGTESGRDIAGYSETLWRLAGRGHHPDARNSDHLTAFHHVHLTNNRLGVQPWQEAQIARLLWHFLRNERGGR
ncbi:thiopeptide-type bacteriocin biosynthesis protein [Nocardia nova]|uniref:thiopeptide-type bacteriocin biosynthesis protein n=1 Tax=Nocardia nova TaxID=37330 RepID=UPI0033F6FF58